MPVVEVSLSRLSQLVGGVNPGRLLDLLPYLGLDIERVEGDVVRVEYSPNRPDYSTVYGIARSLKGLLDIEVGLPDLRVSKSGVVFYVDDSVKDVRPFIAGVVVDGLRLDEDDLRELVRLQEDLHEGIGRRRRKVAIGLHDLSKVASPVYYKTVGPDFRFVPLNEAREWSISEILENHPTGVKYRGALGPNVSRYPVIIDSRGTTLSFPPIINSDHTKLKPGLTGLLIDVTGTDINRVLDAVAVLSETLAEMGGRVMSVTVVYKGLSLVTPDLSLKEFRLEIGYVNKILGLELTKEEIVRCLRRSRLEAVAEGDEETIKVYVPRYRADVMHQIDLVEEVAYGYGFYKLTPELKPSFTHGSLLYSTKFEDCVRDVLVGLGLQEVLTTHLSSYERLFENLGRRPAHTVKVVSPRSSGYEYLRDLLVPNLLWVLSNNTHEPQPHRLFEIGRVFSVSGVKEGKLVVKEEKHLGIAVSHNRASFTEIKSVVEAVLHNIAVEGLDYVEEPGVEFLIEGRSAKLVDRRRGSSIGFVGEVHPRVLEMFKIQSPTAVAELNLDDLSSASRPC